ncbi:hypothetical protein GQX73_g4441 [Xylaria multiplex]|uniref:Uncharacterized protein n=1 Tax=Xylaria multiplex TaxID=323545 RepID=A0A7C8MVL2_9PEZI|nr:hypothetical protein GQX73_g4441 [Xylaria multiplex]
MKLNHILSISLMAASSCHASPTPILDLLAMSSPETELLVREGIKLARSQDIEKRISADFSLEKSWNNEVLFGGDWDNTEPGNSEHASLSVTCVECYTRGTVTAKVTDKHFLDPKLRLGFSGVQAYAALDVKASAEQTFSLNLFASNSPIGIGITGLDVGVVFFVDLVFSLSEAIDLTAGFQVTVPDDAYIEADIFKGDIDDSAFGGLNSQSLPVTVVSGHATFKADLRLRVQAGAEASIDLFGIGAGAVIGIYANIIEFAVSIEKTPTCDLETEIWWDLNVGAYAHIDVVVDYTTLGPVPTVSTTFLVGETITSCWIEAAPTTPALPATTSEAAIVSSLSSASPSSPSSPSSPEASYSPPALSSSLAETGGAGVTTPVAVTSAAATSAVASSTDVTLVWTPSMVLSVTASEVSFTVSETSPTDSVSSPVSSDTSASPLTTASTLSPSSYSQGIGGSPGSVSSAYSSSLVAASSYSHGVNYSHGVGTYSISIPSAYSSSVAVIAGPTYTSTYTYSMTRCGAPGVINCPATYQSEVVVTRTTTICPATATAVTTTTTVVPPAVTVVPIPSESSKTAVPNHTSGEVVVIVLTPLPTPVVATFVAPAENTSAHVKEYTGLVEGHSTIATATPATTTAAITSNAGLQTPSPTPLIVPSPSVDQNVNVPGNVTAVGTGFTPGATQSGASSSLKPVTAGASRLSGFDSEYGYMYVSAAATFVIASLMGIL